MATGYAGHSVLEYPRPPPPTGVNTSVQGLAPMDEDEWIDEVVAELMGGQDFKRPFDVSAFRWLDSVAVAHSSQSSQQSATQAATSSAQTSHVHGPPPVQQALATPIMAAVGDPLAQQESGPEHAEGAPPPFCPHSEAEQAVDIGPEEEEEVANKAQPQPLQLVRRMRKPQSL